ncbi:MAG: PilN domain-containing protein [Candidatus Eisenbacteria bacterium]|nr:PilN domain-containing protein [Candidatus Eisenbacteria bacterium]
MIRVNLLPVEERQEASRPGLSLSLPKRGFWLPLALSIAVLLPLAGIGAMQQMKIASLKSDIARAEAESRRLQPQIQKIQQLMTERDQVNERLITVQSLSRDRYLPVQVMDELADCTPDYLWFTNYRNTTMGQLELEGRTFSNLLVAELMMRMEEADIFENVSLMVAEREKLGDVEVVQFTLSTRVKP